MSFFFEPQYVEERFYDRDHAANVFQAVLLPVSLIITVRAISYPCRCICGGLVRNRNGCTLWE